MTKANLSLLLLAGVSVSAAAQTGSTPTHHTASTAAHHSTAGSAAARKPAGPGASGCFTPPALSPKLPALPASAPCAKPLFTVSERLDALSPLVGPEIRENFSNLPMIFTLGYVDNVVGTGELAKPHMWYTVHYTGYLADGTKFDSSFDHPDKKPISFPYGAHRVIPGWDMGFEGMHVGGKRRLFVPYQLAYGVGGKLPTIPAKSELVFDMELVSQSAEDPTPRPTPPPAGAAPGGAPGAAPTGAPPSGARPAVPGQPGSLPVTPPTGTTPGASPSTPPSGTPKAAPSGIPSGTPSSPATPPTPRSTAPASSTTPPPTSPK